MTTIDPSEAAVDATAEMFDGMTPGEKAILAGLTPRQLLFIRHIAAAAYEKDMPDHVVDHLRRAAGDHDRTR